MEENKADNVPKPGIAEAIHPEIGNGVAWTTGKHEFLLRSPDPSRPLHDLLPSPVLKTQEEIYSQPENSLTHKSEKTEGSVEPYKKGTEEKPEIIDNESFTPSELNPGIRSADATRDEGTVVEKPKPRKKTKSLKISKTSGDETIEAEDLPITEGKGVKAGKLIRKAAKTVKKQEEGKKQEEKQEQGSLETSLSPFTKWLKGLAGSDYVHPYEDDFAFVQGNAPASEGISETFADLLATQGYRDQAIEMYMRLIEKYPEKSGFFAAKIEALQ
jgi:hypothetical protein